MNLRQVFSSHRSKGFSKTIGDNDKLARCRTLATCDRSHTGGSDHSPSAQQRPHAEKSGHFSGNLARRSRASACPGEAPTRIDNGYGSWAKHLVNALQNAAMSSSRAGICASKSIETARPEVLRAGLGLTRGQTRTDSEPDSYSEVDGLRRLGSRSLHGPDRAERSLPKTVELWDAYPAFQPV